MAFDYPQAIELISQHEGVESSVYVDTMGHPTVGVGFNLDRQGAAEALAAVGADYQLVRNGSQSLTKEQMDALLKTDIEGAVSNAQGAVSNFDSLSPARQFVVVDMIFNLGLGGFQQFHQTIAAIEAGDFEKAGSDMQQSAWYGQVGSRAVNDIALMKSGDWSGSSSAPHHAAGGTGHTAAAPSATPVPSTPPAHSGPAFGGTLLELGSENSAVSEWQQQLVALGHSLTVDGSFGAHTEEATKAFQGEKGLTQDGIVGEHTWAAAWS